MARTFLHETKLNNQEILVEYSVNPGEDYFDSPGHICDGGGSGPSLEILEVTNDSGKVICTDKEIEALEQEINASIDWSNFMRDFYSDYD